jgi:HAMP domain-containing protein
MNDTTQQIITPPGVPAPQRDSDYVDFIKKNALALTLQGVALLVLLANLWLAAQLSPLAEGIREVKADQARTEDRIQKNEVLIERFYVVEEKVKSIDDNVRELKSDLKELLRQKNASN